MKLIFCLSDFERNVFWDRIEIDAKIDLRSINSFYCFTKEKKNAFAW